MKNYICPGNVLEVTAPVGGITSGQLVKQGQLIGVASCSAVETEKVAIQITGVYEVAKEAPLAITQGDALYFVAANGNLNKTASGNTLAGYAYEDAASADTTVRVILRN